MPVQRRCAMSGSCAFATSPMRSEAAFSPPVLRNVLIPFDVVSRQGISICGRGTSRRLANSFACWGTGAGGESTPSCRIGRGSDWVSPPQTVHSSLLGCGPDRRRGRHARRSAASEATIPPLAHSDPARHSNCGLTRISASAAAAQSPPRRRVTPSPTLMNATSITSKVGELGPRLRRQVLDAESSARSDPFDHGMYARIVLPQAEVELPVADVHRDDARRRLACSRQSVKPPVEAPISRQTAPDTSRPDAVSAPASLSPPRPT